MSLTAGAVALHRATANRHLPDTCAITDPGTVTTTSSGGTTVTTPSTVSDIACRLSRTGTQAILAEFGEQITAEADYILTLPVGTVIRAGWTVTIVGVTYAVMAVGQTPTWGTAVRAAIIEGTAIGG